MNCWNGKKTKWLIPHHSIVLSMWATETTFLKIGFCYKLMAIVRSIVLEEMARLPRQGLSFLNSCFWYTGLHALAVLELKILQKREQLNENLRGALRNVLLSLNTWSTDEIILEENSWSPIGSYHWALYKGSGFNQFSRRSFWPLSFAIFMVHGNGDNKERDDTFKAGWLILL